MKRIAPHLTPLAVTRAVAWLPRLTTTKRPGCHEPGCRRPRPMNAPKHPVSTAVEVSSQEMLDGPFAGHTRRSARMENLIHRSLWTSDLGVASR